MERCARERAGDNVRGLFWYCKPCVLHWSEKYRGADWRPAKCVMHAPEPKLVRPKSDACDACLQLASIGPDANWNTNFVQHLQLMGYLISTEPDDEPFMAPVPLACGWQYPYPSYIVKDHGRI